MKPNDNFIVVFENTVKECWNKSGLDDYKVASYTYGELATEIEKMALVWKAAGLKKSDKIAINAKSSAAWAITFMASQTSGYVSVLMFNGFTPSDTARLVAHSDARVLYTEKAIFSKMDFDSNRHKERGTARKPRQLRRSIFQKG